MGELTQIVVLRGRVIDVTYEAVSGSGYECAAMEMEHLHPSPAPRVERISVREPPHEAMVDWLGRVVGGEEALDTPDARPLPASSPVEASSLPDPERELVLAIDEQLARAAAGWLLADEMLSACRNLLAAAVDADMLRIWRDLEPEKIAAVVVHCIAKANALVGSGAPFTVAHWLRDLGTTSAPSSRSTTLSKVIGGRQWSHGCAPSEVPDVYVLGDVRLLVSSFRRELLTYRALAGKVRDE
ncbi:hypothetical protein LP422_03675 [Janibacter limosus]|uniref:Uncharacterized protein n=1 Tax=Janibacter limosus TaxID=53458 RepID=A0AC61U5T1_9MICO|nr:hypothetical protein [Janibacter limosus]UUZ45328.1 hypothetical protein LP422_03675 [Janibacter limosus]